MQIECLELSLDLDVPQEMVAGAWQQPAVGTVGAPKQQPRQAEINTQRMSVYSDIGRRHENLDKVDYLLTDEWQLLAVYDGHGLSAVSNYLKCNLLPRLGQHPLLRINFAQAAREVFQALEDDIAKDVTLGSRNCGSTALVVMLTDSTVFVANLGDSRAIFVTDNGQYMQGNQQHNLLNESEKEAVVQRGGLVLKRGKYYRLNGEINLSRSFGDSALKPSLSSIPQITELPRRLFKYLAMATDGFWESTSNQKVADILRQNTEMDGLSRRLYNLCSPKSTDNATIICFELD